MSSTGRPQIHNIDDAGEIYSQLEVKYGPGFAQWFVDRLPQQKTA